jgi:geranylgeranyl diphosphate synthase type II
VGTASDRLLAELKPRRSAVDRALREALAQVTCDAPPALAEAMGYSLLAPGKRLRPLLVVLACEAAGGTLEGALPAACAVEMVHTYSLVHDDLPAMDDDDLRRGLPTCHKQYGEALAILAGDALLTAAFEVVGAGYPPRTAAVSCVELARGAGAVGMVGGQTLDLEAEGRLAKNLSPQPPSPKKGGGAGQEVDAEPASAASGGSAPPPFLGEGAGGEGSSRLEDIHRARPRALFRSSLRLGCSRRRASGRRGRPGGASRGRRLRRRVRAGVPGDRRPAGRRGHGRAGRQAGGQRRRRGKLTYPGLLGVEESRRRADELGRRAVAAAGRLGSPLLADLARYVGQRDR